MKDGREWGERGWRDEGEAGMEGKRKERRVEGGGEKQDQVRREKEEESEPTKPYPYLGPVVQWQTQWLAALPLLSSWPPPLLSSVPGASDLAASQLHSCCGSP